jgi:hypothetical protein
MLFIVGRNANVYHCEYNDLSIRARSGQDPSQAAIHVTGFVLIPAAR